MTQEPAALLQTPLIDLHRERGARLVPFAGWEMPLQYEGILAETRAVRGGVGIFDVSHMGRLQFSGDGAVVLLDSLVTASVADLRPGRARYGFLLQDDGGIIDDVVTYRLSSSGESGERLAMVCNAGSHGAVLAWVQGHIGAFPDVCLEDVTRETAMMAVQGPGAAGLVDGLFVRSGDAPSVVPSALRPFGVTETVLALGPSDGGDGASVPVLVSRTGYTGEDGFEVVAPASHAAGLWTALVERGATTCGLGARDLLRLEAGLRLHGSDTDITVTPLEASLERFVALDGGDFVGREALLRQQAQGLARRMVGFVVRARSIPRHGQEIRAADGGMVIGTVTSGGHSPTLDTDIGMGYVPVDHADPGAKVLIDVRGRLVEAEIVALPFYKRPR